MLKKKSASDFPKADFSVCLSGTPVILIGRTDKTAFRPVVRPSAQKKRLMSFILAVAIQSDPVAS